MTQQIINVGELPNDGSGDPLRLAFQKINDNFTQVFTAPGAAGTDGSFQYRSLNSLTTAAYYDTLWVLGGITQWWTSVDAVTCEPLSTYTTSSTVRQIYAAATGFIAVGSDSLIATSGDGLSWTNRTSAASANFTGVAQNSAGRFVIVGSDGAIETSLDAITWTDVVSGTVENLNAVIATNSGWVAVGDNGTILFSTNATSWVVVTPTGTSENLNSVVYDGIYYIAVGNAGTILRSANGTVWVPIVTTITDNLTSITTGVFDGDTIDVIVGDSGALYYSIDFSTTWAEPLGYTRVASNLTSVCRYNSLYLAVGLNGTVLTSPDAVDWTNVTIPGVMVGSTQLTYNDLTEQLTIDSTTIDISGNTSINTDSTKSLNIGYTSVSNVNVRSTTTISGKLRLPVYASTPNTIHSTGGDIFYNANTGFLQWYDSVSGIWKEVSDGLPSPSNILINGNIVFTLESSGNTSVPGSMIPTVANSYDLGSADNPWRSLYVSNNTIYIDNIPVSVSGNILTVDGTPVVTSTTDEPISTSSSVSANEIIANAIGLTSNAGIVFYDDTVLTSANDIGTVFSVNVSGGNTGFSTTGGPITSTGTITLEGTLNIEHGGTGQTTKTAAFNALAPTSNSGDLIYYNGSNNTRLPIGQSNQILTVANGAPTWANNQAVTNIVAGSNITVSNNGVGIVTIDGTYSYTLPTANTTELGGVKVDGTTIVIDANGVISSVATSNTGDVTFSTNVVQGTGYELGLSPGTGFTTDYQYFRVRGGDVPEHLHFDTTNSNAYDLYVGDDQKFFKLSKDGPAIIQSLDANTAVGYTWTFGIDGNLTLPVGGDIVNSNGSSVLSVGTVTSIDISGGTTGLNATGGPITSNGTITLSGTLNIANGGTGQTNKTAAFDALAPTTTAGDLIYYNGIDNVRLPVGSNNQVLTVSNGIPTWTNNPSGTNYGDSNVISLLGSFGDNDISTTGNISAGNMYSSGALQGSIIVSVNSSGNEGGEIQLAKAPNSTLSGNNVIIDQYVDRIRFFEEDGTTRGAYIDLTQAAAGVGTLLNNRVSGLVNAGTFITMDNLKATVTTSGNRGLSLAAVSGSFTVFIGGNYSKTNSTIAGSAGSGTINTTPSASQFGWDFTGAGDISTYIITDTTNSRAYRITLQIGSAYNNNMISIERLV